MAWQRLRRPGGGNDGQPPHPTIDNDRRPDRVRLLWLSTRAALPRWLTLNRGDVVDLGRVPPASHGCRRLRVVATTDYRAPRHSRLAAQIPPRSSTRTHAGHFVGNTAAGTPRPGLSSHGRRVLRRPLNARVVPGERSDPVQAALQRWGAGGGSRDRGRNQIGANSPIRASVSGGRAATAATRLHARPPRPCVDNDVGALPGPRQPELPDPACNGTRGTVADLDSGGATAAQHPRCDAVALQGEALSPPEPRRAIRRRRRRRRVSRIVGLESAHHSRGRTSRHRAISAATFETVSDGLTPRGDQRGATRRKSRLLCGQRP